eukprot:08487.XXX_112557_112718_1 [CDS] Oithona nana genome sequencing.
MCNRRGAEEECIHSKLFTLKIDRSYPQKCRQLIVLLETCLDFCLAHKLRKKVE